MSNGATPSHIDDIADRLHSAAIHLLRRVRRHDGASGLSAARLSALSVVLYGGPLTVGDLAAAEGVQLPTVSRLIGALEGDGLVRRETDARDRRVVRVTGTEAGRAVLDEARARRIRDLSSALAALSPDDLQVLDRAAALIEGLLVEAPE